MNATHSRHSTEITAFKTGGNWLRSPYTMCMCVHGWLPLHWFSCLLLSCCSETHCSLVCFFGELSWSETSTGTGTWRENKGSEQRVGCLSLGSFEVIVACHVSHCPNCVLCDHDFTSCLEMLCYFVTHWRSTLIRIIV